MNFDDIILREISQSQQDKSYMIPLIYEVSKVVKFIESGRGMVVARGWEKRK